MKDRNKRIFVALSTAASMLLLTGFASVPTVAEAAVVEAVTVQQVEALKETRAAAARAQEAYLQKLEEERKAEEEARRIAEEQAAAEEAGRIAEEQAAAEEARRIAEEQAAAEALACQASVSEQQLLAALIYCEAGNQPYEGQVAVGAVVMNRVRSGVYPNTITDVIYQSGQFGPAMTGWLDSVLYSGGYTDTAMQAAADALAGSNPVGDCLYFGNGNWGIQIGDHYFH